MHLPQGSRSLLARLAGRPLVACAAVVLPLALAAGGALAAQTGFSGAHAQPATTTVRGMPRPVVRTAVRHDLSRPLRSMKPARLPRSGKPRVIPYHTPPRGTVKPAGSTRTADVQTHAGPDTMPAFGQNFEGVGSGGPGNPNCGCQPPDTNMAVGPDDVVQAVNTALGIWDKQGNVLLGPEDLGTVWQGFGGPCDPSADPGLGGADGGDPVAVYDEAASRWFISQLANLSGQPPGYQECIAVSQTADPTGAYFRYDFSFGGTLPDYPKFGVWPDGYYMNEDDFAFGQAYTGDTVTAFNRQAMLAGQQAQSVSFTLGPQYFRLLPSNWEGGALGEDPPAGAPDPFFMECDPNGTLAGSPPPCTQSQLEEWDFHADWSSPANSTFGTGTSNAPNITLPTAAVNTNLGSIDQPGSPASLGSLAGGLMYQSAYRAIGGTPTVVLSQSVNASSSGGNQGGVNWYQLASSGSGWQIAQQGTYAPDSGSRWMPSANLDASGDIAVGYSDSSSATPPEINVAGRLAADPAGQLTQGEETLVASSTSSTDSRWGDYSAMQVDPTDGCTFWYTTEYHGSSDWNTRIGSFKYPSCTTGPHGEITGTVTDAATGQPLAGATVSTSAGVSTVTDPQGHYSITLPPGTCDMSVTGPYGYGSTTVTGVQVTGGGTTTQNFALTAKPSGTVSGTVSDGSGHGWPLYAQITIDGYPGGPVYTDPFTGRYSVLLVSGTYTAHVAPAYPGVTQAPGAGYQERDIQITVGTGNITRNATLDADLTSCTAPGYGWNGLSEAFTNWTGTTPQDGWAVTGGTRNGWRFDDPGNRPPPGTSATQSPLGDSRFAVADSALSGPGIMDTTLTSPVFSLAGQTAPALSYDTGYYAAPVPGYSTAQVQLSADGGQTWSTLWQQNGQDAVGHVSIPIPQAAGKTRVQIRFRYTAVGGWYWAVDDIFAGTRTCVPVEGGLVEGIVTDHATGQPLNGATVTSLSQPAGSGISTGTTDPSQPGGFYFLFAAGSGSQRFTASATGYTSATKTGTIAANQITRQDWTLTPAGGS